MKLTQVLSKELTLSSRALTSFRSVGLDRPSAAAFSAPANQGENSLIPVLYSAQYLTSLENLSHSTLVLAWRSSTYFVILASSSLKAWASAGTLSPWGRRLSSVSALALRISSLAAMSSWRSMVLATLSSGSIPPEDSWISLSSAVAASFQESIALRELSKAERLLTRSTMTWTVDLNLPRTSNFSSTALISFWRIFFLSSGIVMAMQL